MPALGKRWVDPWCTREFQCRSLQEEQGQQEEEEQEQQEQPEQQEQQEQEEEEEEQEGGQLELEQQCALRKRCIQCQ